jgi:hypothetical protein
LVLVVVVQLPQYQETTEPQVVAVGAVDILP